MATLTYACPPPVFAPPPVDQCTEIDVLDIVAATNAGDLGLATAPFGYLQLICVLVEDLDLQRGNLAARISELSDALILAASQLEIANGTGASYRRELEASRDAHQACLLNLETMTAERDRALLNGQAINQHRNAVLQDVDDARKLNIALSNENRQLRTVAAFDTTSRTITGLSVPALNAQLNADPVTLGIGVAATQRVMRCRGAKPTVRTPPLFDLSEVDTIVIDEKDIPVCDRTPTPRERTKTMGEENGWDR